MKKRKVTFKAKSPRKACAVCSAKFYVRSNAKSKAARTICPKCRRDMEEAEAAKPVIPKGYEHGTKRDGRALRDVQKYLKSNKSRHRVNPLGTVVNELAWLKSRKAEVLTQVEILKTAIGYLKRAKL